jgi:MSHA pilin protein MshA
LDYFCLFTKDMDMKNVLSKGFTLIELIIVMIIVGILAAIVTPKFIDLESQATRASKDAIAGSVRSAWAVAIADRAAKDLEGPEPTVPELAGFVNGGTAAVAGIEVDIRGTTELVPTYHGDCITQTDSDGIIKCIPDPTVAGASCAVTVAGDRVNCIEDIA